MWQLLGEFWSAHRPIFSILLPAFAAFILIVLGYPSLDSARHTRRLYGSRVIGLLATLLGLILGCDLLMYASSGQLQHYVLGGWAAPFGIILVLDRLSALMIGVTYLLALPVVWYATGGWDQKSRFFHAFFQFQLMGLCGAFLTGDLFNLFVFFEILLMASYVLLLHGQGRVRFRMGVHYVIINLVASAIFLIGLALIYGSVGSLNMVDVARLLPGLPDAQRALAQTAGMLLLVVFGIKAAMLPLSFWLPNTYAAAATPVAALFAIMTKVGIYAILRVNGTIFAAASPEAGSYFSHWLLPIGLLSALFGSLGALAAQTLRRLAGYLLLASVGTLLMGLGLFSAKAWSASLYYLPHSTFAIAAFYLWSEWVSQQRSATKDTLHPGVAVQQPVLLGISGLILMLLLAGLPPLSGFLGKVMLLQSALDSALSGLVIILVFLVVLVVSLLSLIALVRAGITLFWQAEKPTALIQAEYRTPEQLIPLRLPLALFILLGWLAGLMIFAAPIRQYADATAIQLKNPVLYQKNILQVDAAHQAVSVQSFDSKYIPYAKTPDGLLVTDEVRTRATLPASSAKPLPPVQSTDSVPAGSVPAGSVHAGPPAPAMALREPARGYHDSPQ